MLRRALAVAAPLSGPCSTGSPRAAPPTPSLAPAKRSKRWNGRPARSTWSSTGRGGSARSCSGRGWSAPLGGVALGLAFLRRRSATGLAAARPGPRRLRRPRLRRPRDPRPATRCSPPRCWRSSPRSACSAGGCSSPASLAPAPGRRLPAVVALMFVIWGPTSTTSCTVDTDLTNQALIEGDLNDLAESGAFGSGLRADLGPQPPRRSPPRLRSRRAAEPDRQLQRAAPAPARLLPRPGEALRRPQLRPRPQRPVAARDTGPRRLPRGRPQLVLGSLPALSTMSPLATPAPDHTVAPPALGLAIGLSPSRRRPAAARWTP